MATGLTFTRFPFDPGEAIPEAYSCEGTDVSPPLAWQNVPDRAETLTLIVDDPDAPGQTFTHWVLVNIPADQTEVPRDLDIGAHFASAASSPVEGLNDFNDVGYGGPCPPPGDGPHRYFFRLYALDAVLDVDSGASRDDVERAMNGHIIDQTDLIGTYERS
jgi:Raf kinase inhibitor-like YbhB/YbcL family protein